MQGNQYQERFVPGHPIPWLFYQAYDQEKPHPCMHPTQYELLNPLSSLYAKITCYLLIENSIIIPEGCPVILPYNFSSIFFKSIPLPSTGLKISPSLLILAIAFSIVKSFMVRPFFT